MRFYFNTITYKDRPLIWEFNPDTDVATCLFVLHGQDKPSPDDEIMLGKFLIELQIPELTFESNGSVTISNARRFFETHSITNIIPHLPIFTDHFVHSDRTYSPRKRRSYSALASYTTSRSDTMTGPESSIVRPDFRLETLIPQNESDPTPWGNTIAYFAHFQRKVAEESGKNRNKIVLSIQSQQTSYQNRLNTILLHPAKKSVMQLIKIIIDDYFNKVCMDLNTSPVEYKKLSDYLRKAIENMMLNARYKNDKPTKYERMSEQQRIEKFGSDSGFFKFSVQQKRHCRAQKMMRQFLFFVSDEMSSESVTQDPLLVRCLTSVKAALRPKRTELTELYRQLEMLIIQSGLAEHQCKLNIQKLQAKQSEHMIVNENEHSCYHMVEAVIKLHYPMLTASTIAQLTSNVIKRTIITINAIKEDQSVRSEYFKLQIATLNITDPDFYIRTNSIASYQEDVIEKIDGLPPRKSHHNTQIVPVDLLSETLVDFIYTQLVKAQIPSLFLSSPDERRPLRRASLAPSSSVSSALSCSFDSDSGVYPKF